MVAGCDQPPPHQAIVSPPAVPKTAHSSPLPAVKNIEAEPSQYLPDSSQQKDLIAKGEKELCATASSYCEGGEIEDGMKFFNRYVGFFYQ